MTKKYGTNLRNQFRDKAKSDFIDVENKFYRNRLYDWTERRFLRYNVW